MLSVLAQQSERFTTALQITNEEWRTQTALIREAGQFAQTSAARLQVVQNQLQDQATGFGQVLTPVVVAVAENFRIVELAIAGAGVALASRFGLRAIARVREYSQSIAQAGRETETLARQELVASRLARARASQAVRGLGDADVSNQAVRARNRLEVAGRRATVSTLRLRAAQEQLGRTLTRTSRIARLASGTLGRVGGAYWCDIDGGIIGGNRMGIVGQECGRSEQVGIGTVARS